MIRLRNMSSWIAVFIALSLSACSDDNDNEVSGPAQALGVTPVSVSFKENKTATVTVDYTGRWEAGLSDTTWCVLDKSSGEGKGEIGITLKPNAFGTPKGAKLTVSAVDRPSIVSVVQLSLTGTEFYADPIRVEFGYGDNASYEVNVICPGSWTATLNDKSWCDIDKSSGTGNDKIRVTSKFDLSSFGDESALLTVASVENPSLTATVEVKQIPEFVHGGCITLNKATKGKGIDFVIVGDAFAKSDMGIGGHWQQTIERCRDIIFKYEPFASFREYFNVYAVTAVSGMNVIPEDKSSNTFFGFFHGNGPTYGGNFVCSNLSKVHDLAYNNSPVKERGTDEDMTILVVLNDTRYGGFAQQSIGVAAMWDGLNDLGQVSFPSDQAFPPICAHEFLGHAFGKLADEYYVDGATIDPNAKARKIMEKEQTGYWGNVEFTKDPNEFINKNWAELYKRPEYRKDGVGIIPGGEYAQFGVWRSIDDNMMRGQHANPFFGPVNREILVRRIYKLAGEDYTLEKFIEYDKKNLKN